MLLLSGHDGFAPLNDVAYGAESTKKKYKKYVKIASLKSVQLINRIPGSRLLISSLPGWALRTHVKLHGKPRDVKKYSQNLA